MWFSAFGWLFTTVSILGNSAVVCLVITKPRLHTPANWFVLSLAVADLFVGLTYFPGIFISKFLKEFSIDHTGLWFKLSYTFLYLSSANLCALTADRYMAITKPLGYTIFLARRGFVFSLILAWVVPLILFTLPSLFSYRKDNASFTFFFEVTRAVIFQLVPCVIFVYVIARLSSIAKSVSRRESIIINQIRFNFKVREKTKRKRRAGRKSSLKMIIFIISLFILCYVGGNYLCFCKVFKFCTVSAPLENVIEVLTTNIRS